MFLVCFTCFLCFLYDLEHYFEMSRYDAERALDIYKKFVKQTADVADYLSLACRMEVLTRIEVPNIKHVVYF